MSDLIPVTGIIDLWQLVLATVVFLMLPGPGTFCVLTCAARNGLRGGLAALAGIMLGDTVLMVLAAIGVAALLQSNPTLFKVLQYLGAAYLAWLGLKLLLAKSGTAAAMVPFSGAADFRRGLLITLINPKAIVFYMAFFPLFISSCTLLYGSMLAISGSAAAARLKHNRRIAGFATKAAGLFLIGFGIKLTTN
jgi:leucine efflux protein